METNMITEEQLNILVDRIDGDFQEYFESDKSNVSSLKECFLIPEIYKEQGLWTINQDKFQEIPEEIQKKTYELIAELAKAD